MSWEKVSFFLKQFLYTLTGGLYYEFTAYFTVNLIHFLIYSLLVILPFFFILIFGFGNIFAEIIYSSFIFLFILSIKLFNAYFHHYFDTHSKGIIGRLDKKQANPEITQTSIVQQIPTIPEAVATKEPQNVNTSAPEEISLEIEVGGNLTETTKPSLTEQPPSTNGQQESDNNNSTSTVSQIVGATNGDKSDNLLVSAEDVVPQFDGPSDEEPSSATKIFIFEYVDEMGITQSYEMVVSAEEYERLMAEKNGTKTVAVSEGSSSSSPTSIQINGLPVSNGDETNTSSPVAPAVTSIVSPKTPSKPEILDEYYKIELFNKVYNLFFDRRTLEYLFDRDYYPVLELIGSPLMAFGSAWMGLRLLALLDRNWASIVFMIFAIAQAHFSLIKSPQPETNSPFHFTKGTAYSRCFYILFFGAVALICNQLQRVPEPIVLIYGVNVHFGVIFLTAKYIALFFIMCFPVIFLFGILPQTSTFIFVFLEQIHMHFFGGSGVISLTGVVIQLIASMCSVGILIGVGYASARDLSWTTDYYSGIYSGLIVALSFLLSRMPSNHRFYWSIIEDIYTRNWSNFIPPILRRKGEEPETERQKEQRRLKKTRDFDMNISGVTPLMRILLDLLIAVGIFAIVTIPQLWDAFQRGNPYLLYVLTAINVFFGMICYYLYPQLSKHYPFTFFRFPLLSNNQPSAKFIGKAKWLWYEIAYYVLTWIELVFYIVIIISGISSTVNHLTTKCHPAISLTIASICGIKLLRCAFYEPKRLYLALFFSVIISHVDAYDISEGLLVDFWLFTYIMPKMEEISLKLKFIIAYSTPPLSWASGWHLIMQPLGVPFSQFFFVQLLYSVISNAPMYPLIGGALWFLGYSRGAKFWEKDYRTKRKDTSNQTLGQTIGGGGLDQHSTNNLNSIFYEHMVNALRNQLPEIIRKGKLGPIQQGDIFIFINDNLTTIVHFIEVGNGVVSYQIRGLEFKGTLCQEEEQRNLLSAVNRDESGLFDSCEEECFPGAPKIQLLHPKDMVVLRWHTWQVIQTGVKLRTYNMLENKVENLMSSNDERKVVIILYVRSVLFYLIESSELDRWISESSPFLEAFNRIDPEKKTDFDPLFSDKYDDDFDDERGGITFKKFIKTYSPFIDYFVNNRTRNTVVIEEDKKLRIQKLCFLASLTARRALASHSGTNSAASLRTFVQTIHQLFVGDYRITSANDEWVFSDISILDSCIKPAICMSLRLYQARFTAEDVESPEVVSTLIKKDYKDLVITHEGDPKWRESIMAEESEELFSLRKKVTTDKGTTDYFILMLEMRDVEFNVVKMNREGVKSLWASQQHELVFLGVQNMERGSIQNMASTLRNICNSCMDIPIGYPVMVSSVTTAYW